MDYKKTVKERENLPSTPLSRLTDDDTSKNNSDEEISDDEAAEEVTEEPDTAADCIQAGPNTFGRRVPQF